MAKNMVQHGESLRAPGIWDWFGNSWPTALRMLEPERMTRLEEFIQGDRYVVRTELPGIDPDKDVEITIQDGILTLHGERQEESRENQRSEFYYGAFSRSVALPGGADEDDVKATYKDGILQVSIKLGESKPETRKIPVQHD
jgi:HSP20 family protein